MRGHRSFSSLLAGTLAGLGLMGTALAQIPEPATEAPQFPAAPAPAFSRGTATDAAPDLAASDQNADPSTIRPRTVGGVPWNADSRSLWATPYGSTPNAQSPSASGLTPEATPAGTPVLAANARAHDEDYGMDWSFVAMIGLGLLAAAAASFLGWWADRQGRPEIVRRRGLV